MVIATVLHNGRIAADVLALVCEDSHNAYAYSITKRLNAKYGEKYTHNLEVGGALQFLAKDGILMEVPSYGIGHASRRIMYAPTEKAGFYLALLERSSAQ